MSDQPLDTFDHVLAGVTYACVQLTAGWVLVDGARTKPPDRTLVGYHVSGGLVYRIGPVKLNDDFAFPDIKPENVAKDIDADQLVHDMMASRASGRSAALADMLGKIGWCGAGNDLQ